MPAGRYFRQNVSLAWIQGDAPPTPPTSVYLHLCTTAPTATVVGTAPTITGYAPLELEPADWAAIATGADVDTLSSAIDLTFGPFSSADETATHWMLMDGSDPGADEIIAYGALTASRTMANGGTLVVESGDLDITA